jgi:hypothetical protein
MNSTILINGIIWAIVILIASYFFKGSENFEYVFAALIIGFTMSNGLVYSKLKTNRKS